MRGSLAGPDARRLAPLLVGAALTLVACRVAPDPACPREVTHPLALYGPFAARGTIHFAKAESAADGRNTTPVRVTLDAQEQGKLEFVGLATCRGGIIRARLAGSDRAKPRVLGAALELLYQPTLVPGQLVGGFSVQMEDLRQPEGFVDFAGFVGTMQGPRESASSDDSAASVRAP